MKFLNKVIITFILFTGAYQASAQVQYGVSFDRERYLQYEKIKATLTIVNNSGARLNFGQDEGSGKLKMLIIDPQNTMVNPRLKNFNPMNGLVLAAGETKSLSFNLNEHFRMSRIGRYKVSASLTHPAIGGLAFQIPDQELSVEPGTQLHKKTFGVSDLNNPNTVVSRSYEILTFKEDQHNILCLKVYDKNWIHALQRIGPYVHGVKLNHDVDTFTNIHTLVQVKPRIFIHMIFSNEGNLKQFVVYKASFDDVPQMNRNPKLGTLSVTGGKRLVEGVDYVKNGTSIELKSFEDTE